MSAPRAGRRGARAGVTIVELIVGVLVGSLVVLSGTQLMLVQGRAYSVLQTQNDVRDTERSAVVSLGWDIRHAAAGGGQFTVVTPDSVALRSITGVGVVCAKHPTLPRLALWSTAGTIQGTSASGDSVLLYSPVSGKWHAVQIGQVGTPASLGVTACAWAGQSPALAVELVVGAPGDTADVQVGAPVRSFHVTRYAEAQVNGRWWLARRVGSAAGWEQLTGPLLAPAANGLKFAFYDSTGAVTAVPANVSGVALTIHAASQHVVRALQGGGPAVYTQDSVITRVTVRR